MTTITCVPFTPELPQLPDEHWIQETLTQIMIYRDVFLLVLTLPFLLSVGLTVVASFNTKSETRMALTAVAVIILWFGIAMATNLAFQAWQATDDAPQEAFYDSAVAGAFVFGWVPAIIFCTVLRTLLGPFRKSTT